MNIIITGPSASGKTFIARAIATLFSYGVQFTNPIGVTKFLLRKRQDLLFVVDECADFKEIRDIEETAIEEKTKTSIIYCTNAKPDSDDQNWLDQSSILVIDLYRSRNEDHY